ncbi:hypothetical protein BS47DRAFT_1387328 [Hydnum rufescens UP504]|uniref:t-SNARE coiled-coil homology domain-containing protein n=1 Tax=Hydnum rufescens UP504 TaxID=1448309 RepID=A0A9P6BAI8_9AGAM|nr:hypothetical protein BS47DRAFT_1387328 [Hydnum rufescens UP504]
MARDRLAALRAQRGDDTREPPHELSAVGPTSSNSGTGTLAPLTDDLSDITAIEEKLTEYRAQVASIANLHSHSLSITDDAALQQDTAKLEATQRSASAISAELKRRIQILDAQVQSSGNPVKRQHAKRVREKFKEAIQDFQRSEFDFRTRYRQRVERQFRIVKPEATPEEIREVVENPEAGGQIFSNAVATSNRYGESRAAYKEVQDRHQDIKRIEVTLSELAQLFNDMAVIISEDDDKIDDIVKQAKGAQDDVERGLVHTEEATRHARAARKKKIICFLLFLLICAVIAIAIAVPIVKSKK